MSYKDSDILKRLGNGDSIESVMRSMNMDKAQFHLWWETQTSGRNPQTSGKVKGAVSEDANIFRDANGIPHIFASSDHDLFWSYGYAMAQDRLWQLDYYRKRGMGRLSEILGPDALEYDRLVRTIGLNHIAIAQSKTLPVSTMHLLEAFSSGINAVMEDKSTRPPIEFELLDYRPEPWSPLDSIAILTEFKWYLTGRMPVIYLPEIAKRYLSNQDLYKAFLTPEAGNELIVPEEHYSETTMPPESVGEVVSSPDEGVGSNNWVANAKLSVSGAPILASDPHIAFGSVSCWYQAHLSGESFDCAGTGYVGVPGFWFGRNQNMAWGLTNNICSQRDLYQETANPDDPDYLLYGYEWKKISKRIESIKVKGSKSIDHEVASSHNGPIVNQFLPEAANSEGPVSIKWLGSTLSDETTCLINMNRAADCKSFREAIRNWTVPTLSFSFADKDGNIAYQSSGRIPIRKNWDRGFRPGWEPEHQWDGLIPYDQMPQMTNPPEGWIRSANNRTASENYPYPLSGQWSSGYRAKRIRHMLEENDAFDRELFSKMQSDVFSERAADSVPVLIELLEQSHEEKIQEALKLLKIWDFHLEPESGGAAIFEIFFIHWSYEVALQQFSEEVSSLLKGALAGLSVQLLRENISGWFTHEADRNAAILKSMNKAIEELEHRIGKNPSSWSWGTLHKVNLPHLLDGLGDLGSLLSRGGDPVGGSGITVSNTGFDPNYLAGMGANFRLIVDLGENPPALWTVDAAGQSGHLSSKNYCDQLQTWLKGKHNKIYMNQNDISEHSVDKLVITR
ncbi:MAG: penicillin acylase family protein [Chloroflexota bacterium]|nr:penicillin acylase family protein [Chloroflexota bacterium]